MNLNFQLVISKTKEIVSSFNSMHAFLSSFLFGKRNIYPMNKYLIVQNSRKNSSTFNIDEISNMIHLEHCKNLFDILHLLCQMRHD